MEKQRRQRRARSQPDEIGPGSRDAPTEPATRSSGSAEREPASQPRTPEDAERARRRLYERGADQGSLADYLALRDDPTPRDGVRDSDGTGSRPRRPRGRGLALVVASFGAAIAVVIGLLILRGGPPSSFAPPAANGTTIAAFGRAHDPAVKGGEVTFQPEGYSVFRSAGQVVRVTLRCRGKGSVRVSASSTYDFRCTDADMVQTLSDGVPVTDPFMVLARTTGDVVWSVRVALVSR